MISICHSRIMNARSTMRIWVRESPWRIWKLCYRMHIRRQCDDLLHLSPESPHLLSSVVTLSAGKITICKLWIRLHLQYTSYIYIYFLRLRTESMFVCQDQDGNQGHLHRKRFCSTAIEIHFLNKNGVTVMNVMWTLTGNSLIETKIRYK